MVPIALVALITGGSVTESLARPARGSGGQNLNSPNAGAILPDQESALEARARGEILPLEDILKTLGVDPAEHLVDVDLNLREGKWIYDITWLTPAGRYHILTVEASNARLLQDQTK